MKKMIRKLTVTMLALLLTLGGTALALDPVGAYTPAADALKALGLFQGTDQGYELERAPSRQEAAVMLVRLLGKEEEAMTGTFPHPFADVDTWADPHVGYMYQLGLTKGVSDNLFGSDAPCDASMYATFLLRALDYSDNAGDFSYVGAVDFAAELGLLPATAADEAFLRGNIALASYNALCAPLKGQERSLLQKLVEAGAVSRDAAAPLLEKFDAYSKLKAAGAKTGSQVDSIHMTAASTLTMGTGSQRVSMPLEYDMKLCQSNGQLELAFIIRGVDADPATVISAYYKNGWVYLDDGTDKYKTMSEAFDISGETSSMENSNSAASLLSSPAAYDALTYVEGSNDVTFSMALAPYALNEILPATADVEVASCLITQTVGTDGQLKQFSIQMELTMYGMLDCSADITMSVVDTGDAVKISFPDFSQYQELPQP